MDGRPRLNFRVSRILVALLLLLAQCRPAPGSAPQQLSAALSRVRERVAKAFAGELVHGPIDVQDVSARPRAVLGYVSDKPWAFIEFLCMAHASWRHLLVLPGHTYKLDMLVVAHPNFMPQVSALCEPLDLEQLAAALAHTAAAQTDDSSPPDVDEGAAFSTSGSSTQHSPRWFNRRASQCFAIEYAPPAWSEWHGYPFVNNVHFLADPRVEVLLKAHGYGLVMKTDFDTFLSPAFLHWFPDTFQFGIQEYVLLEQTSQKLRQLAQALGLRPLRQHNLGPTWYGDVDSVLRLARASLPILHYLVHHEFPQLPGGGVHVESGWPLWSAGMAALYATELAASHVLSNWTTTHKMDEHADSDALIEALYHLHCRHGDSYYFSKFEFLKHHFDELDLHTLNVAVARDYATYMAVATWRQLAELKGLRRAGTAPGSVDSSGSPEAHPAVAASAEHDEL